MSKKVKDTNVNEALAQATAQADQKETRRYAEKLIEESRNTLGNVNFTYSKQYQDLKAKVDTAQRWEVPQIVEKMEEIQLKGTISDAEKQSILDGAIALPLDKLMSERDSLTLKYNELGNRIKNLSLEEYQKRADTEVEANRKKYISELQQHPEYSDAKKARIRAIAESRHADVYYKAEAQYTADKQALMIEMWETDVKLKAHELALSKYISENNDLISQEMEAARRAEIRGSLRGLAELIGTDDSVLAYLENAEEIRGKAAKALSGFLKSDVRSESEKPEKKTGAVGNNSTSHTESSYSMSDAQWEKYLSLRAAGVY